MYNSNFRFYTHLLFPDNDMAEGRSANHVTPFNR